MKTVYQANDGTIFDNEVDCVNHEMGAFGAKLFDRKGKEVKRAEDVVAFILPPNLKKDQKEEFRDWFESYKHRLPTNFANLDDIEWFYDSDCCAWVSTSVKFAEIDGILLYLKRFPFSRYDTTYLYKEDGNV